MVASWARTGRWGWAAALALVLAACGGGGGGGGEDVLDGGNGVLTADEELAVAVNLVLTDFPQGGGWSRQPAPIDVVGDEDDRRFAACMGRPPADELRSALADSDAFSTSSGTQASSSVQVMREEAAATADFQALAGDRAVGCIQERLDTQFERDLGRRPDPAARTTSRTTVPPSLADDAAGFRYVVEAASRLVVDNYFVRVGRAEIALGVVSRGGPVDTALVAALLERMVTRAG